MKSFEVRREAAQEFNQAAWQELAATLGVDVNLAGALAGQIKDEAALTQTLSRACRGVLTRLYQQVDQQIHLLQSDAWLDAEIANREGHLRIKQMLLRGQINEAQWNNRNHPPKGIGNALWREFLDDHSRVRFHHLKHPKNLNKSIANDQNFIAFLEYYRDRARQELSQPYHIDFREGGPFNREVSRKYGKPYDTMFMRMLSWVPSAREEGGWEIYIPGSTVKGAFRKRASQLLKTLWNDSRRTQRLLDRLFGRQGQRGLVFFADAYLTDPFEPEENWCVMDGVKMDPKTGQPIEGAKQDYLFAYGDQLNFRLQLDLMDMTRNDMEAFDLLAALLQDFQQGDIPLGGEKTSGFGWVQANIIGLTWLTGGSLTQHLFGEAAPERAGIWQQLELDGAAAAGALQAIAKIPADAKVSAEPPRARAGFISHSAFGGYSGHLAVEAEILTPTHVRESGQPSYRTSLDNNPVNGWDSFALGPAEAERRSAQNPYALPSKSLRGMLRHIYTIASNSAQPSPDISSLNPADSLFGWVGMGPNQAIMGRVVIDFGMFDAPELGWFKVPYPYGGWRYVNGRWQNSSGGTTAHLQIAKRWRVFPHVPLAPIAEPLSDFTPDAAQASYVRAILPGARARFNIRFWNLEEAELQRLIWCVTLDGGGHKIGKHRHLGFGSLRLQLLPESHLIDWPKRYASGDTSTWQQPIQTEAWLNREVIKYYEELHQATNVDQL
jgi:CRISPR/Cas system CSM-associated protein Csm3 (group 7 of RAMP superfamily)